MLLLDDVVDDDALVAVENRKARQVQIIAYCPAVTNDSNFCKGAK